MIFQLPIHSSEKVTDVYMNKCDTDGYIVAIPEIHWSIFLPANGSTDSHFQHILQSLMFQLFEGNAESLAKDIIKLLERQSFRK
ncbi:YueH family protein [Robertmurraya korlensis]|uniref:YueH family protein n=1 Tax=Robertmurraya korlensis TaxID=519977 RepID=UPI0020401260|nr:YueH family protein [Robertmurraya korlensis]MCM3602940.1 YueH family protein [Robertmurraya korlensis]